MGAEGKLVELSDDNFEAKILQSGLPSWWTSGHLGVDPAGLLGRSLKKLRPNTRGESMWAS